MGDQKAVEGRRRSASARTAYADNDDAVNARDYLCGAGSFRPRWMQAFSTPKWYAIVLAMLGTCQGAYRMYLTGTLSTIERRFSLSSRQSAFIMIGDDVSPILANIALMAFLGRTSKPNWMSAGMICCFLGTLCNLLPYAVYGPSERYMTYSSSTKVKHTEFCGRSVEFNEHGLRRGAVVLGPLCRSGPDDVHG
ncbi:hypothetical protein MRX96_011730 [Rhipicephalus microplus]